MSRILVIDDDQSSLYLLQTALERMGHEVFLSDTALNGVDLVRKIAPDMLLLDIRLRHTTGYEVARQLRQAGFDNLPIIAVSVPVQDTDRETALAAGCNAFLAKPFSVANLRELVSMGLN